MNQPAEQVAGSEYLIYGLVADEVSACLKAGREPNIDAIVAEHPELANQIRELVPALMTLDQLGHGALPSGGPIVHGEAPVLGQIGDYRIVREIGRGGMGVVYEAEQISLNRPVALKILPFAAALDSKQLQRFKNEALAAAHLHHQNIVPVYGVGSERGVHFYAMQYIAGQSLAGVIEELRRHNDTASVPGAALPLTQLADRALSGSLAPARWASTGGPPTTVYAPRSPLRVPSLTSTTVENAPQAGLSTEKSIKNTAYFRTVAHLGQQAAEALEHAYQFGVIHRDIKPANLLLDAHGRLWVTDFGLARFQDNAGLTMTGDLVGTLRYMSPEQALAKRVVIDHRTDIYSLGATLYELLTLQPAFAGRDRQELLRQIAFEEPKPPRRINNAVPADLETIVLKALGKNPEERYATAQDLVDDLRRFLEDKPIWAKRPTLIQVTRKWARRHQSVVATLAASLVVLLAGIAAAAAVAVVYIDAARRDAEQNAEQERAARRDVEKARNESEVSLYFQTLARAQREREAGNVGLAEQLLDDPRFQDRRGWEWHYLKWLRYGNPLLLRHTSHIWDLALSSDGRLLAAGGGDGSVKIWDTQLWEEVRTPTFKVPGRIIRRVAFGPGGRRLAATTPDGTVTIWDVATGAALHTVMHGDDDVGSLVFSPDGRQIVAGGVGSVKVWDAVTGRLLRTLALPGHTAVVRSMAFSPDGGYLALGNGDQTIKLWDTAGWTLRRTLGPHAGDVVGLAFRPDGAQLAAAYAQFLWNGSEGEVKIWDVATGQLVHSLRGHVGGAFTVAFTPDGRRLASGGVEDAVVKLWDLETGREALTLRGHWDAVWGVVFSPDGRRLYSAGFDQRVRAWDATPLGEGNPPELRTLSGHKKPVTTVAFSPDQRRLVSGSMDRTVKVWDALTGQEIRTLTGHTGSVRGLAFSPDGLLLASVSQCADEPPDATGEVKLWDTKTWKEIFSPSLICADDVILSVAFRSDGRRLAAASPYQVMVWDTATRTKVRTFLATTPNHISVAFGPGGRLASSELDGTLQIFDLSVAAEVGPFATLLLLGPSIGLFDVWQATTSLPDQVIPAHQSRAMALAFSPDGASLVSAGLDGTIKFWDTRTYQPVATLRGHLGGVNNLTFRPDGKRLASAGSDATIRVWDPAAHRTVLTLRGHTDAIYAVAFSPDGRFLASGGWDKTVKLWDAEPLPEARRLAPAGPDE